MCEKCSTRGAPKRSGLYERENKSFYGGTRWQKVRKAHLDLNPLCKNCLDKGHIVQGRHVDHIIPITQGGEEYSDGNLQTLCIPCHNIKTKIESMGAPKDNSSHIFIVHGAPCSGKNYRVKQLASLSDVIIDLDAIADSITFLPAYQRLPHHFSIALAMREAAMKNIVNSFKRQYKVFVLTTKDKESELRAMKQRLNTQSTIHVETGLSECLKHLSLCPDRKHRYDEYAQLIVDYFK